MSQVQFQALLQDFFLIENYTMVCTDWVFLFPLFMFCPMLSSEGALALISQCDKWYKGKFKKAEENIERRGSDDKLVIKKFNQNY